MPKKCDYVKGTFMIPSNIDEDLDKLKAKSGESKTYHVRTALRNYIRENKGK